MGQSSEELLLKITGDSSGGQRSVSDLAAALKAAQKDVEDIQKAFAGVGPGGDAGKLFQEQLTKAQEKVTALSAALKSSQQPVEETTAKWKEMASAFTSAGTAMHSAGSIMTATITAPLVGAGVASVKFFSDYEANINRLITQSQVAKEQVALWKDEILALGPAVGVGPEELSKAMLFVTSTGFKGAEAMDILKIAAKGAAVGMGETADVARMITSAMHAYAFENLSAAKAGDILQQAIVEGNVEAKEMANVMGRVMPLASQMGVTFGETASSIAMFTRLGVHADEAATALRGTLAAFEKPGKMAKDALAELGMTFEQLRQEIKEKGLAAALLDLIQKSKGHEEAIAHVIPNIRALTGVLANAAVQGDEYVKVTDRIVHAVGTLDQAHKDTQHTVEYTWKVFRAEMDTTLIKLGQNLAPAFVNALHAMQPMLSLLGDMATTFHGLPTPMQNTAIALAAVTAAAGPAVYILGTLALASSNLMTLWLKFPAAGAAATAAIEAVTTGMSGMLLVAAGVVAAAAAVGGFAYALTRLADTVSGGKLSGWLTPFLSGTQQLALQSQEAGAGADAMTLAFQRTGIHAKTAAEALALNTAWLRDHKAAAVDAAAAATAFVGPLQQTAVATSTLAEKVRALTAEQKDDIVSKRDQHESIKAIAKETGIAADVVSMYLGQLKAGSKTQKEWAKDVEQTLQETIKAIEYSRGTGEQAALGIGKSLGGQRNVLMMDLAIQMGDVRLAGNKPIDQARVMGLMPDFSWLAKQHMDSYRTTMFQGMGGLFTTQLPNVIIGAVQGGGNVANSIGSVLGGSIGNNLGKMATETLGGVLGKTLGPMLGPLGALAGQLLGPAIDGLKSLFGGVSAEEKKARESVAGFEAQIRSTLTSQQLAEAGGQSWKQTVIGIRDAFIATGRSEAEAEAAAKSLWDSSRSGAAATKAAIDAVSAVLTEQKQDQADLAAATQRYGFTIDQLGPIMQKQKLDEQAKVLLNDWRLLVGSGMDVAVVNSRMASSAQEYLNTARRTGQEVPIAMQPIIQKMIEQGLLTDANGAKITDMKDLGVTFSQTMTQGFEKVVAKLDQLLQKIGLIPAAAAAAASGVPDNPFKNWAVPDMPQVPEYRPMAEGGMGHITKPTWFLAGEKPGGEDVAFSGVGKRFDFSRMGGGAGGVVIHAPVTVEGNVLSERDLFEAMGQHFADTYLQTGGTLPLDRA